MVAFNSVHKLMNYSLTVCAATFKNSRFSQELRKLNINYREIFAGDITTFTAINKFRKLLKDFNPDIIHTHLSHDLWTIVPAMKLTSSRAKLFLTKHMAGGYRKNDTLHKHLYNRVNGIFSVSQYVKQSVAETCPVPESKLYVLPNGIETSRFNPELFDKCAMRDKYKIPGGSTVITIIGRMTPGKGHEEFLAAAAEINRTHDNVFFVVTGSASKGEDDYEKKIRDKASELNLQNLIFTGYAEDVREILSATDILAFPSHNESFGVTLTESMAMKVPVAASSFGGVLDIVEDEVNGLLYPPKDFRQLTNVLIRLINNPELRQKLADAGRKTVEEKFDSGIITNKLMEHYKND